MDLIDEQIAIEENAHHEALARYHKQKMKEDTAFASNAINNNLLSHLIPAYAVQLDTWLEPTARKMRFHEEKEYFRGLDLDTVGLSIATLRVVFKGIMQKNYVPLTKVALEVYTSVHTENAYKEFVHYGDSEDRTKQGDWRALSRKLIRDTKNKHTGTKRKVLSYARRCLTDLVDKEPRDKLRAGCSLLTVALSLKVLLKGQEEPVKVLRSFNVRSGKKTQRVIAFTPEVEAYLNEVEKRFESVLFTSYPMVVPPTPWESLFGGGYLTPRGRKNITFIKTYNVKVYDDKPISRDIYEAVNIIQSTAWAINSRVYDVLQQCADSGLDVGGLPVMDRDLVLPGKVDKEVWDNMTKDERSDVINIRKAVHESIDSNVSKIRALKLKLSMARRFKKYKKIYYPHNLDFRCRTYPTACAVNPQSDKFGQALLQFAEALPLGPRGEFWLAVHGANTYGLDSEILEDRVQWVKDNEKAICEAAEDPMAFSDFWRQAEDAFGFLAFCFEWRDMCQLEDRSTFKSRLPIKLDATSSGLQHYAAMFRDVEGGEATNIIGQKRSDIYKRVVKVTKPIMAKNLEAEKDPESKVWKRALIDLVVRKVAKQPTMCYPYGISKFGATDAMIDLYESGKIESPYLENITNRERVLRLRYLGEAVLEAVGLVVQSAKAGMDWLKLVEKAVLGTTDEKVPVFNTPLGFPVVPQYHKATTKSFRMFLSESVFKLNIAKKTKKIDKRKSNLAWPPNFIHSMDATHLMKTALTARQQGITSFSFIHDDYGVHACHTDKFRDIIRQSFVWLYEKDVLASLHRQWTYQYPEADIPPVPTDLYGDLSIQDCLQATYMFN